VGVSANEDKRVLKRQLSDITCICTYILFLCFT